MGILIVLAFDHPIFSVGPQLSNFFLFHESRPPLFQFFFNEDSLAFLSDGVALNILIERPCSGNYHTYKEKGFPDPLARRWERDE
jgi:hypothetical protein